MIWVAVAHWPVLTAQALCFDDEAYVVANPLVQNPSWASTWRFLSEVTAPSTVPGYYQPLTMISLMLDWAAGGRPNNLLAFHLTSLGLHLANTALLIGLLYALFGQPWPAALAGLLFGVHPLSVEPTAWLVERKTVLTTFFSLWSLLLYVRYTRRLRRRTYVLSLVTYLLAVLSKPTSVPLPLLMLVMDFWPLRRATLKSILEKVPFLLIAIASAAITIISQHRTATVFVPRSASTLEPLLRVSHLVVFYLGKALWPTNLCPVYLLPRPLALSNPRVLAECIGVLLILSALAASLRWTRAAATGTGMFLIALAPTLGIIGFTWAIAADKYAYLPLIGLVLPIAGALTWIWGREHWKVWRWRAVLPAVLVVAIASSIQAYRYAAEWSHTERLGRRMVQLAPDSLVPQYHLAVTLLRSNSRDPAVRNRNLEEAEFHYREALRLEREDPAPQRYNLSAAIRGNLGILLAQRGKLKEAIETLQDAVRCKPTDPEAHFNLGVALMLAGRNDDALAEWQQTLALNPAHPRAHIALGRLPAASTTPAADGARQRALPAIP